MISILNFPNNLEELIQPENEWLLEHFSTADLISLILKQKQFSRIVFAKELNITLGELAQLENSNIISSKKIQNQLERFL